MTGRRTRILGFSPDLVVARRIAAGWTVFDEFGPLEVRGGGWRKGVDRLVASGRAAVLLVVRQALV